MLELAITSGSKCFKSVKSCGVLIVYLTNSFWLAIGVLQILSVLVFRPSGLYCKNVDDTDVSIKSLSPGNILHFFSPHLSVCNLSVLNSTIIFSFCFGTIGQFFLVPLCHCNEIMDLLNSLVLGSAVLFRLL